jgi:hypothetical protein
MRPTYVAIVAGVVLVSLLTLWSLSRAAPPAEPAALAALADEVTAARREAIVRFRNIRQRSRWQALLDRELGELAFNQVPTAEAARAVAERLALKLHVASGVEGTVTYKADGTLGQFTREGLAPRYWYLELAGDALHLKPHVQTVSVTFSSEQGQKWAESPEELDAIAARCGAMKEYREAISTDPAGAGRIHGRAWFIDKAKKALGLED